MGKVVEHKPLANQQSEFFRHLYQGETGYVYMALKGITEPVQFKQLFFKWPTESASLLQAVEKYSPDYEVFVAPALFLEEKATKASVKGANVVWVEFDGNADELSKNPELPTPSCVVQSSTEGHQHVYWALQEFTTSERLEAINRQLAYLLHADCSGWDSSQVLRPPGTFNHKRQRETKLLILTEKSSALSVFDNLPIPPPLLPIPIPTSIPPVEEVVFKYPFSQSVITLFRRAVPVGERSAALMALGFSLAEMGLADGEIVAMLMNFDSRIGKFSERQDRMKRLLEIVTIARQKYPHVTKVIGGEIQLTPLGFKSILTSNVTLEWVWESWLQKNGFLLMAGAPGIGKTSLSLDVLAHFAIGLDVFNSAVIKPQKIGFFSLEMGLTDLKYFLQQIAKQFTDEQLDLLEENFLFFPLGEPLFLNSNNETKRNVEQVILDHNLDGIAIDSLSSAIEGEIGTENVKPFLDWNDSLRQRHDCFTWVIHHMRKATSENKKPNKLSDVYGSMLLTARATTVIALWATSTSNMIEVIPLKLRLAAKPETFNVVRSDNMHFEKAADKKPPAVDIQVIGAVPEPMTLEPVEITTEPEELVDVPEIPEDDVMVEVELEPYQAPVEKSVGDQPFIDLDF